MTKVGGTLQSPACVNENLCTDPNCMKLDCMYCSVLLNALNDGLGMSPVRCFKRAKFSDDVCNICIPPDSSSDNIHVSLLGSNTEASADDCGLTQAQVDGDKVGQASACEIPTLSHATHAEPQLFQPSMRSARTRSQSVQVDRGPSGHLNQLDDTDL